MAMTLKYAQLNNPHIMGAFNKLMNQSFGMKLSYRIARVKDIIQQEMVSLQVLWTKLTKEHAELNDKGEPTAEGMGYKLDESKRDAYEKGFAELMDIAFEMKWDSFTLDELESAKLTPAEFKALEGMITFPPEPLTNVVPFKPEARA